ncbi:hypothetical protein M413DRAFT_449713, partial [Hebeloma cylindrosporum]
RAHVGIFPLKPILHSRCISPPKLSMPTNHTDLHINPEPLTTPRYVKDVDFNSCDRDDAEVIQHGLSPPIILPRNTISSRL